MNNIPMFTTATGVASLILEEIPCKREAYIKIQSSASPSELLEETVAFCKAVGAETIYATGHEFLNQYPLHTEIILMKCNKSQLGASTAMLRPIDEVSLVHWCEIYNAHMKDVPNTSTITRAKARKLLRENNCYFVYDNMKLIGIGKISKNGIDAIVSLFQGRGKDVMLALCSALSLDEVSVEVAINNIPAMKLYQKLGFTVTEIISKWYCVSGKST